MTLATISETPSLRRSSKWALSFDALLMAASFAVCAALFAQGGLEASMFAMAGGIIAARRAPRGVRVRHFYSGAFAGLFVGAMFAGFFHDGLISLLQLL